MIVTRSEGQSAAKGQFKVGNVIDGNLTNFGQVQNGGPGAVVGIRINPYRETEESLDRGIPVGGVHALAFDPSLQSVGNYQTSERRDDGPSPGNLLKKIHAQRSLLVRKEPANRNARVDDEGHG